MLKKAKIFIFLILIFTSGYFSYSQDIRLATAEDIWMGIMLSSDTRQIADAFIALGDLAKGNQIIIDNINNYLIETNALFASGNAVDYTIVSSCITALMNLGDGSSYPALFSVLTAGYPEVIAYEAIGALDVIPANLHLFLLGVIENNPPLEKFIALRIGINSERLTVSQRGQLAELALELGIAISKNDPDLDAMRFAAVQALTSLKWKRATSLAVRHFYRVHADFFQGNISKDRLIEAIACLGAVGNSDAALALVLQLGLINARAERTGVYDAQITLAIINALGNIGDNAAFDHLLSAGNLSYNDDIKSAATEAVARLKW